MTEKKIKLELEKYAIDYSEKHVGNQFVFTLLSLSAIGGGGLACEVGLNEGRGITSLEIEHFDRARLNVAEGYSENELLEILIWVVKGDFQQKKAFLSDRSILTFPNGTQIKGERLGHVESYKLK